MEELKANPCKCGRHVYIDMGQKGSMMVWCKYCGISVVSPTGPLSTKDKRRTAIKLWNKSEYAEKDKDKL